MRASPLRWLFRILLALAVTAAAALAYAPYLPRLLAEGYPRPEWPAMGSFAAIKGAPASDWLGQPLQTTLSPALAKLFAESDGKALLVYQGGQLKLEYYAPGFSRDTQFNSYSLVKILSLRAIARGELPGLDTALPQFGVTPRDLLDMKSGIIFETDEMKHMSGASEKDLEATISNPFGPMARLHVSGLTGMAAALHADLDRPGEPLQGRFTYFMGNGGQAVYLMPERDLIVVGARPQLLHSTLYEVWKQVTSP